MYRTRNPNSYYDIPKNYSLLNRILLIILILLVVVLVGGTAIALTVNDKPFANQYRKSDPTPQKVINISGKTENKVDAFTDLGQIRTVTKPKDENSAGCLLIVSPWFSYQYGDTPLYEELAQKALQEKSIIMNYFATYTESQLLEKGEKKVKEELLVLLNEQLVMGKIKNIYFDQYMFFE